MAPRWRAGSNAVRTMARTVRAGAARLRPLGERRQSGRVKAHKLGCNWGSVIDLSSGGMRLRSPRRLRGALEVELWTRTLRVTVHAEVVWCSRAGFRKYDTGLEFHDVTDEINRDLTAMALFARHG